jgi:hypothetical protein
MTTLIAPPPKTQGAVPPQRWRVPGSIPARAMRSWRGFRNSFSPNYRSATQTLKVALAAATADYDTIVAIYGTPTPAWLSATGVLLTEAQSHLDAHEPSKGWASLKTMRRQLLRAYAEHARLKDGYDQKVRTICYEALEKLEGYRLRATATEATLNKGVPPLGMAQEILRELDQHEDSQFRNLTAIGWLLVGLIIVGTLAVGSWIVVAPFLGLQLPQEPVPFGWQHYSMIALCGAMGAIISLIFSAQNSATRKCVPEQILGWQLFLAKVVVGVLGAEILTVFLLSGFVETELLNMPVLLALAITAGFSERIVNRVLDEQANRVAPPPAE